MHVLLKNNLSLHATLRNIPLLVAYSIFALNVNAMDQASLANTASGLSQQLLYAVKTGAPSEEYTKALEGFTLQQLEADLPDDAHKKSFWINIYNAYTQILLKSDPASFNNRNRFFSAHKIPVAGAIFSLDDIEHGILRRSKWKWSMGYINTPFPNALEKRLRVDTLDYRIHFALNCGAKSCPPIAFYTPANIEAQLSLATKTILTTETVYHADINTVSVPALFNWYRGDFGGTKKIITLLATYGIIPSGTTPNILYNAYDWSLYAGNFAA